MDHHCEHQNQVDHRFENNRQAWVVVLVGSLKVVVVVVVTKIIDK
jgi:hypothetical protein